MATHSSVLAWRVPGTAEPAVCGVHSQTRLKRLNSSSSSSGSGHLMQRANLLGKTRMLGKSEGRRRDEDAIVS